MQSHLYSFTGRDLIRIFLAPGLGAAALGLLLHAAAWCRLLPASQPLLDPDKTLLSYKSQTSRAQHPAEIILLGDSSCAADVDAPKLSQSLPGRPPTLNLGLIIGLNLSACRQAMADFIAANPGQVRLVVLLVTPQKLKNEDANSYYAEIWNGLRDGERHLAARSTSMETVLGIQLFRQQLLSCFLNVPLKGKAGGYYGFASTFGEYLIAHHGSMIDPASYESPRFRVRTDYSLSSTLENESRHFRDRIPDGIKFAVGLTPVPESHQGREYERQRGELLRQWNQWLQSDILLTNLPARLPDGLFATGGHLNARGQQRFTRLLARELAPALDRSAAAPQKNPRTRQ